jgi:hypothetical protein
MSWEVGLERLVGRQVNPGYTFDPVDEVQIPLPAGKKLSLGRGMDCDVVLPCVAISRRHCEIWRDGTGVVWVRDLMSRNGTFLGGCPVVYRQPVRLRLDDVVRITEWAVVLSASFAALADWREWENGLLLSLARGVVDERRLDDLPILADALEDCGCTLDELLAHLREEHALDRPCWIARRLLRGLQLESCPR